MRAILILLTLLSLITSCATISKNNSKGTTIYLVRHAEKEKDGTPDPALTEAGHERAARLAKLIGDDVAQVYSSDFKRTRKTAEPTAVMIEKEVSIYKHKELAPLVEQLKASKTNALVVGHSNSTPTLANLLIGSEAYSKFDESDYTNIIVIHMKDGKMMSHELRRF